MRAERHELAGGQVGLAEQRLLGERAERPQEPDPQAGAGVDDRARLGQDSEVDPAALRATARRPWPPAGARGRRRRAPAAPPAVRRSRLRPGRPPPALRQGLPEAVYGPGKTPEQCAGIVAELLADGDRGPVLLTRADDDQIRRRRWPRNPAAVRAPAPPWCGGRSTADRPERIVVATAGTADGPVADECARRPAAPTASPPSGSPTSAWPALHRLLAHVDTLAAADAVVVVAGMEGALASVVGGLTGRTGRGRAHQRRVRRRVREASPRCWPCWRRAPRASPWSASTTASAPRAP